MSFKYHLLSIFLILFTSNFHELNAQEKKPGEQALKNTQQSMMIRIAELEIDPAHLEAYNKILTEEAAASIKKEPGVIAIFPMYIKDAPNQVRIIEIYASQAAYQSHLKTPHFLYYKTNTAKMVTSLKLVEMESIDPEIMVKVFKKM